MLSSASSYHTLAGDDVFQKIWPALFSCNTHFEISHFALLPTNGFVILSGDVSLLDMEEKDSEQANNFTMNLKVLSRK